jgi:hypothetical protein
MLLVAGLLVLAFAVFHMFFWRLFGWPERLEPSGGLNSAITQTLNVMLTYVFVVYGGALVVIAQRGGPPPVGLLLAGCGFGLVRAGLQFLWFPMRNPGSIALVLAVAAATTAHGLAAMGW